MLFHASIIPKIQNTGENYSTKPSLTIADLSQGGTSIMDARGYVDRGNERLGFTGNKIHIPGLKKGDAEELKAIILQRVTENPVEDSQSGL